MNGANSMETTPGQIQTCKRKSTGDRAGEREEGWPFLCPSLPLPSSGSLSILSAYSSGSSFVFPSIYPFFQFHYSSPLCSSFHPTSTFLSFGLFLRLSVLLSFLHRLCFDLSVPQCLYCPISHFFRLSISLSVAYSLPISPLTSI